VKIKAYYAVEYTDTVVISSGYVSSSTYDMQLNYLQDKKPLRFSGFVGIDSIPSTGLNILLYDIELNKPSETELSDKIRDVRNVVKVN